MDYSLLVGVSIETFDPSALKRQTLPQSDSLPRAPDDARLQSDRVGEPGSLHSTSSASLPSTDTPAYVFFFLFFVWESKVRRCLRAETRALILYRRWGARALGVHSCEGRVTSFLLSFSLARKMSRAHFKAGDLELVPTKVTAACRVARVATTRASSSARPRSQRLLRPLVPL